MPSTPSTTSSGRGSSGTSPAARPAGPRSTASPPRRRALGPDREHAAALAPRQGARRDLDRPSAASVAAAPAEATEQADTTSHTAVDATPGAGRLAASSSTDTSTRPTRPIRPTTSGEPGDTPAGSGPTTRRPPPRAGLPGAGARRGGRHDRGAHHRRVHPLAPGHHQDPSTGSPTRCSPRPTRRARRRAPRRGHATVVRSTVSAQGDPRHLGYGAAAERQGLPAVAAGRAGSCLGRRSCPRCRPGRRPRRRRGQCEGAGITGRAAGRLRPADDQPDRLVQLRLTPAAALMGRSRARPGFPAGLVTAAQRGGGLRWEARPEESSCRSHPCPAAVAASSLTSPGMRRSARSVPTASRSRCRPGTSTRTADPRQHRRRAEAARTSAAPTRG